MTGARIGSWILGVVVLLLLMSRAISAIGPAVVVLHGGALQVPVVIHPPIGSFVFAFGQPRGETRATGIFRPTVLNKAFLRL